MMNNTLNSGFCMICWDLKHSFMIKEDNRYHPDLSDGKPKLSCARSVMEPALLTSWWGRSRSSPALSQQVTELFNGDAFCPYSCVFPASLICSPNSMGKTDSIGPPLCRRGNRSREWMILRGRVRITSQAL